MKTEKDTALSLLIHESCPFRFRPLGKLSKAKPRQDILRWQESLLVAGWTIILPEITDFEIRRNLILENKIESLAELDRLKTFYVYQPITTLTMLKAAELWADARRSGKPTADPKELDSDVILAAMAIESKAIVATENVGHLIEVCNSKALVGDNRVVRQASAESCRKKRWQFIPSFALRAQQPSIAPLRSAALRSPQPFQFCGSEAQIPIIVLQKP